jgi:hypothetical protein
MLTIPLPRNLDYGDSPPIVSTLILGKERHHSNMIRHKLEFDIPSRIPKQLVETEMSKKKQCLTIRSMANDGGDKPNPPKGSKGRWVCCE